VSADPITWPRLPSGLRAADENREWRYPGLQTGGVGHLRSFMTTDGVWLLVVSQLDIGASVTNAAEDIYTALVAEYGRRIVYLEHWPSGARGDDSNPTLHMVVAEVGLPFWRAVWPCGEQNPDYATNQAWIRGEGAVLLDALGWDGPR
jgi:hypothetical protein